MTVPQRPTPGQPSGASYWSEKLAGRPPALELPGATAHAAATSAAPAKLAVRCAAALSRAYKDFLRAERVTFFDGWLALWAALLHRTTGQSDLLLGLREKGCDAALRFSFDDRPTFREHLARTVRELESARAHALERAELLRVAKATRIDALFQVMFTDERLTAASARGFDLALQAARNPRGAFTATLFHDARNAALAIARMAGHVEVLLAAALERPDQALAQLPLLTADERQRILERWNDTAQEFPRERCLHELFEENVASAPDAPAVAVDGRQLTYAALDARSNRLAHHLCSLGVGPDVPVGIAVERSFEMVIGLMAIAKAGGAYVPMDPSYPRERLAFLLEDSRVRVLLTQEHLLSRLPEPSHDARLVLLDGEHGFGHHPSTSPDSRVRPEHLAYLVYTSGSTGKPKGVMLDHRGRVNNFTDFNRRFRIGTGDALMALASLSFDMCAYDVFGTLAAGATILLPLPDELRDPRAWARRMQLGHATVWHTAPAMLQMLVEACETDPSLAPRSLRLALLGGDWIPVGLPDRLRAVVPGCRVIALGGATEVSMDSTIFEIGAVDPDWRSIPYGRPMANQRAYVLDAEREPVPALVPGELYLGGVGVARGYWNRPELTAERFVPDPFAGESGARMYRTGDLVRWREDGTLELLGRMDNQVKIRGYRIELGEIEARLRAHPAVREGVVVARAEGGERVLVVYFVPRSGDVRPAQRIAGELREHLAAELPNYMVPVRYVALDALPLSPNGKVDRKRLPEPAHGRPEHLPPRVAPRDPVEEVVAGIWADVLGLDDLGVDDPFLELGGHSILAAQVQARLAEILPFEVTLRDLFDTATVAGLARRLAELGAARRTDVRAICRAVLDLAALDDRDVARLAAGG